MSSRRDSNRRTSPPPSERQSLLYISDDEDNGPRSPVPRSPRASYQSIQKPIISEAETQRRDRYVLNVAEVDE